MADHDATETTERATEFGDREETVLASPGVQAVVDEAVWTGTAEVLLGGGPRPVVSLECLFDQGVEAGPAAATVREPERVKRLLVDGNAVAGKATRATFFDDNEGPKVLVTWRPEAPPTAGVDGGGPR